MSRNSPAPGRPRPLSMLSDVSDVSDTRRKQSKRDEVRSHHACIVAQQTRKQELKASNQAIRKKIENELNRKRPGQKQRPSGQSSRRGQSNKRQLPPAVAGTVSALRPSPALTVPQSISVADASQLCAAKRTDCVLVVDDEEHLCGIFTAKDLAFRVIGEGLDPRSTPVANIMTPNPMVTRDTTSATDALQTMVTRHFRHLPVCNEEGDVVGLLDITKVFHSSLEKLERAYGSSQQLYNALEGVQSEWSGANAALVAYVEQIRESMAAPDLGSLLDARTAAVTISVKTSVREAARMMREHRTTAVIVLDNVITPGETPRIAGIFTSKDIVLRVIAAGLDARTCSVVRVMTPHPSTAFPSTTIQEALRKMHDGHFLNLPVVDEEGNLAGCVDVLKLTYATLEQISAISAQQEGGSADPNGGPMWSKFFNSFAPGPEIVGDGGDVDGDTESVMSASDLQHTPLRERHQSVDMGSEVAPGDSASVVLDDGYGGKRKGVAESSLAGQTAQELIVDDGTYLFKFLAPGGTTHRFQARYEGEGVYELIKEIIQGKLTSDPFFKPGSTKEGEAARDPTDFKFSYLDDDGDLVLISSDRDIEDAVKTARKQGKDRIVLQLRGGHGWENEMHQPSAAKEAAKAKSLAAIVEDETEAADQEERRARKSTKHHGKSFGKTFNMDDDELLFGVLPKEYVLPAAIAFLGVSIIGVFAISRASR